MNWTSTKVPLWRMDCENFWRAGTAFELRDVTTEEHKKFVQAFSFLRHIKVSERGTTAYFERPDFSAAGDVPSSASAPRL